MRIFSDKEETVYRYERDGKVGYSIGISHKLQDGTYDKDYFPVKFKNGVDLKNKTKIIIKEGWLDFFKKDKKSFRYAFINKFELASGMDAMEPVSDNFDKVQEQPKEKKDDGWVSAKDIEIDEDELPFY